MRLFKHNPTIRFYPRVSECDDDQIVLKSREKKVVTLDIGPFRAKETILQNGNGSLLYSLDLRALTPHRCTFGYDVMVHVGYALFVHSRTEQQIIENLIKRNVQISPSQIGFLGKKFIVYLAIAHHQSRNRIKLAMASRGGYILHLDGTCEGDSPHLFTGLDGIAQIVLDNIKLPSERADLLIPFFRKIKQQYGEPAALVHDMGKGILSAVNTVFKGIPDFICHFHFLRDIGKDLFEEEYAEIRNRLRTHNIRPLLNKKRKALEKIVGGDDQQGACALAAGIKSGCLAPETVAKMPAVAAYVMVHWTTDTSELEGYGFPFDCSHFLFYQRVKILYDLIKDQVIKNKELNKLRASLAKVVEDQQLEKIAEQMRKKVRIFKKLREALCITVAKNKKGLNDDGEGADMKSIEQKVKEFRKEIEPDKDYKKMAEQIDRYWDKLFADPIIVNTPTGQMKIRPQRTNNILERFFRDLKRRNRKRSGTISLNKTLSGRYYRTLL